MRVGDEVLSSYGSGDMRPARVAARRTQSTAFAGVEITLASGRTLVSTPEHVHFAGVPRAHVHPCHEVACRKLSGIGIDASSAIATISRVANA